MSTSYPRPTVVTRTEWGCPDGQITTHGALSYTNVTHLIVHHTVNDNDSSDWPAVVRSIWNFHVFDRGYADIGYNYLIDPNGTIYEGRAGGDNVRGAHFSGVNTGTMGVAMLGEFTGQVPTDQAINSLKRILAWKSDQRSLDPVGMSFHLPSGLVLKNISGHRDGPSSTECPGNALYGLLPAIRDEVSELITNIGAVACVSAASFHSGPVSPESIVAAFGTGMASSSTAATSTPLPTTIDGTSVMVRDSAGIERYCGLFYISPDQINFQIPPGTGSGTATTLIERSDGRVSTGELLIAPVAPGLFSANANGEGVASALVLRVKPDGSQVFEPVAVYDQAHSRFVASPIDLGDTSDQVYLVAFGTGIRFRSSLSSVSATIGGSDAQVLFAGPAPGFSGLDQVNLRLPSSLVGRGEVDLELTVQNTAANILTLSFN